MIGEIDAVERCNWYDMMTAAADQTNNGIIAACTDDVTLHWQLVKTTGTRIRKRFMSIALLLYKLEMRGKA